MIIDLWENWMKNNIEIVLQNAHRLYYKTLKGCQWTNAYKMAQKKHLPAEVNAEAKQTKDNEIPNLYFENKQGSFGFNAGRKISI